MGELGLNGRVASSPGVLLAALHASSQGRGLVCPEPQGPEAAWAGEVEVIASPDLLSLLNHFKGSALLPPPVAGTVEERDHGPDLAQVKGQETAKRAVEIAAAGGHNLLLCGTSRPRSDLEHFERELISLFGKRLAETVDHGSNAQRARDAQSSRCSLRRSRGGTY